MRLEYFQLIDRIVELDLEKQTIRTQASVPTASTIFEGHFPGFPLMPGVLLLESMAQASGWLIIGVTGFSRMPFLAAFNQAKLRAFVKPGDTLEVTAAMSHEGSGFARTKAEIRHDGKLACNAEITFRVVEFPNQEFRQHMEKAAAALAFPMERLVQGSDRDTDHG
jgi:3-hydroxyacyl-[acyl-carrier-protein] dehydratase